MKTTKKMYKLTGLMFLLLGLSSAYAQNKACGDNMVRVDSVLISGSYQPVYAIYSGDINQDGNIDLADFSLWDVDNFNFNFGYIPTDLNGDGNTDLADFSIWDINNYNFVGLVRP
jgi:hypothetical protein